MEKLDAKMRPVGTLLSQEFFLRVPEYQRPFSWTNDNFEDLINDIITANKDQEYFLGTVVLHRRDDKGHYDVVDGQQRLTSLLILLACLRDLVKDKDFKRSLQEKILQRKNVADGIPEKVRLEVKDRQIFTRVVVARGGTVLDMPDTKLPEPEWRYVDAVKTFRAHLGKLSEDELHKVITFVSQKCVVIYVATSDFDDAFRLFTIVNDRGKQLRRIDILKAINIAPDVITKETVRSRVAQQWEEIEKALGEATFEAVFHLIRLILLKDKPQSDLLREFETRIFPKKLMTKGEPFFDAVFKFAQMYSAIFIDRDIVPEGHPEHTRFRALIHIMDAEFEASEWRACVLSYASRFGAEGLYRFCLRIEKLYLAQWVSGVRKDERLSDYAKILALIESSKAEEVTAQVTFDVESIKKGISRSDLYNAGFGKYMLLRLELAVAEHAVVREFTARSVEHVLPQNPNAQGYWAQHHNLTEIDTYVNTIGNLVLLSKGKNSSASNLDFEDKKSRYLKERVSDYPRSLQVLGYADWTKEIIAQRTAEACELVLRDP